MKNLKKKVLLLIAVVMTAALAGVMSVSAATETLLFADFTDTTVENLPMHNTEAGNDGGRIKKDTAVAYEGAAQSGRWAVTGNNSSLVSYYPEAYGLDVSTAGEYDSFVLRFNSSTDRDAFNVLMYDKDGGNYYAGKVYVTEAGWQEVRIPVSEISTKITVPQISYFLVQKGGWGIDKNVFNQQNILYFDKFYFEKEVKEVSAKVEGNKLIVADFTDTTLASLPMNNANSADLRGQIRKETEIVYGDAKQSGSWVVANSNSDLAYYYPESWGFDISTAGKYTNFVLRLHATEDYDVFTVCFYDKDYDGVTNKDYTWTNVYVTKAGWQTIEIPMDEVGRLCDVSKISHIGISKGGWGTKNPNAADYVEGTHIPFNPDNIICFDKFYFEKVVYDVAPMKDNQLLLIDFSDRNQKVLPMTNVTNPRNDSDRIVKNTEIYYGASEQSGSWHLTNSNSALAFYNVADSKIDLAEAAKYKNVVLRFYSESANDYFGVLFNQSTSPYYHHNVKVEKAGWQTVVIPVSSIETKVKIQDLIDVKFQKGAWNIVHPDRVTNAATQLVFDPDNTLYFDRMYFETPVNNVAVDADDISLGMNKVGNSNLNYKTDVVYKDSTKALCWETTATNARHLTTNTLKDLGIDTQKYDKFTVRMNSESYDEIIILAYYTKEDGTQTYKAHKYYFSEDGDNIGKWCNVVVNISDIPYPIDFIQMSYNGWGMVHNVDNKLYIDKIWFGDDETIVPSFNYTASAFENKTDVGIFDTIVLDFDSYLAKDVPCNAVFVKRDGNDVTEFKAWTEKNQLFVKLDAAMKFDTSYEIKVTTALLDQIGDVLSSDKTITFKTVAPYFAMDEVKLTDALGKNITKVPAVGETVKLSANVINGSDEDKSFVGIIAMYDGEGKLLKVYIGDKKTYDAGMVVQKAVEVSGAVVAGATDISAFIWDGMGTMVPYVNSLSV